MHFHAIYAEYEALIEIETGNIHEGYIPKKALELVNEWRLLHREELKDAWQKSRQEIPLSPIAPL
jgi:hypothetical protein